MSATTVRNPAVDVAPPTTATLRALAVAESRRFARHPIFLLGVAASIPLSLVDLLSTGRMYTAPLELIVVPAFFLGVFGFVVGHRLTTSMRRTDDLVGTAPVEQRRRTAAICLACLVPAFFGLLWTACMLVIGQLWPPVGVPAGAHVAWFGNEPAVDLLSVFIAGSAVAALGGSLLGVAVARWAPFRGSALLGLVCLLTVVLVPSESAARLAALSPFYVFSDGVYENGRYLSSTIRDGVAPTWYLVYTLCLCGLAAVAALVREKTDRRRLIVTGGVLAAVALGSFALSVS